MDSGRGFRDNILAKCRGFVAKSRDAIVKCLRIHSHDLQQETAPPSPRQDYNHINLITEPPPGGRSAGAGAAPENELKTTLVMSFGAAIAIFGLLNSTSTKASSHSLYLLIGALIISFSASLIGLALPWLGQAMEPIALTSIAVTFFMTMSLLLPEGMIRWMAQVVGALVLLLYLGPFLRKVYDRIRHHKPLLRTNISA
ncbi:hypothetical protein H6P81_008599 [Aristolochia fimbriata]|uniref:Uncharacterized protein n=1 Tax=Aristolochia fimbriata TaxID=158543 RepID=A0AAV7EIS3_ARIFI|nr:hypothetical protein H6P81_008599 [Aristolochia fimbriata]